MGALEEATLPGLDCAEIHPGLGKGRVLEIRL
ncbi:MAG: hypothetical protein H6R22_1373, partial [Chromatiaceae bacterium]|nr:hypothetical protein [Chromatiaceae bacterium]